MRYRYLIYEFQEGKGPKNTVSYCNFQFPITIRKKIRGVDLSATGNTLTEVQITKVAIIYF